MTEEVDNLKYEFTLAREDWDDRNKRQYKRLQRWQWMAYGEHAALGLCIFGLIHMGSQAKTVVLPIAVDRIHGTATTLSAATEMVMDKDAWNQVKRGALTQFVTLWRSVTTDDRLRRRNWDQSYEWVQGKSQASADLDNWYSQNDPNNRALHETVSVAVESGNPLTANTFVLWWTETTYKGGTETTKRVQGVFTYRIVGKPTSENNGLGILITEYTIPLEEESK